MRTEKRELDLVLPMGLKYELFKEDDVYRLECTHKNTTTSIPISQFVVAALKVKFEQLEGKTDWEQIFKDAGV